MDQAQTRILFVDDDPIILELIKFAVSSLKGQWETHSAKSAEEALELLDHTSFEVVVSDLRLPGMSGAQLLNAIMRRTPGTVRIILSGYGDQEEVMRCVGATHQFLLKPFKLAELQGTLKRIQGFKARLRSPEIQQLATRRESLPSVPQVYFEILDALQNPECSAEQLGDIVMTDPALSSKLLQLVNSAFLGYSREVSSVAEAVMILGTGTIRSLTLSLHLFSAFNAPQLEQKAIERVWAHSARVARLAQRIGRLERGNEKLIEEAFTAGLLHDIGKLLLADNPATAYLQLVAQAEKDGLDLIEAERKSFQATHAEVGAYLLDLWGLPMSLVEAVAFHHEPRHSGNPDFGSLTCVHAANALEHESSTLHRSAQLLDIEYLEKLDLDSHLDDWRGELADL